jgi:endonuclease-8
MLEAELLRANVAGGPRVTLRDEHRRAGERFYVYRRQGRPCMICSTTIAFRRQGDQARASYYCPRCQRVTG